MSFFPNLDFSSEHLLDAQAHIWNHIFNFINSMALKCALQLGIPDIVHKHGKPMTLSELIQALPIHEEKSQFVYRLMRILIHSKFFANVTILDKKDQSGYWLTPASHLLLKDDPLSVGPFALAMLDPLLTDPWHHLQEWFQNDVFTPFATAHGSAFWELAGSESRMNRFFNDGMASDARLVSNVLVKDCGHVFHELKSLIDVGGGIGTMAKAIAQGFQGLKCTVLDLPHVVADLEGTENLNFVGGDMFESIPKADAVFFKWILHDWSDEECVKILEKCKESIPNKANGGKVIIVDMVVVDNIKEHTQTETQLFFDMLMMVLQTGKERTEKEWEKIFVVAGFTSYKITPILGLRSVIEVFY